MTEKSGVEGEAVDALPCQLFGLSSNIPFLKFFFSYAGHADSSVYFVIDPQQINQILTTSHKNTVILQYCAWGTPSALQYT